MYIFTIFNIYKFFLYFHSIYIIYSLLSWIGVPVKWIRWFLRKPNKQINNEFIIV